MRSAERPSTCKDRHVELYRHMGYAYIKPSDSDHGGMAWHEMVMVLRGTSA